MQIKMGDIIRIRTNKSFKGTVIGVSDLNVRVYWVKNNEYFDVINYTPSELSSFMIHRIYKPINLPGDLLPKGVLCNIK